MENNVQIIRTNQYQTSKWSGGTTTQLLIYPKDANYSDRNFKWRISSAKVEVEESIFTHLPGISRILMVINGEMNLEHEGRHKIVLGPFEQDSFMGDWTTKSFGKVTDFNLMMGEGCTGNMEALSLKGRSSVNISINEKNEKSKNSTEVFYIVNGEVVLTTDNSKVHLNDGDLVSINSLVYEKGSKVNFYNSLDEDVKIIRVKIFY